MSDFNFKKKYGQNFLVDVNIVNKIVSDIDVLPNSLVIEIGCGDGRLTKVLCEKFDKVLGYEIDLEVKERLLYNLSCFDNVEVIFDDFLNRNVNDDLSKYCFDNLYIVANLPYYITTPIITKFIDDGIDVDKIIVMVQKEVGDRLSSKPNSKDYGSLTVFINYYFEVKKLFTVSKNVFVPKPNVDSVVISLEKKKNKLYVKNDKLFFKLVRDSFRQKRKTLRNNLKEYDMDIVGSVLCKYGYNTDVRAEALPLEIFVAISNELSKSSFF